MSELNPGHEYLLACTNEEYFNTIRPSESYLSKLNKLKDHLLEARAIASLGMAGGEDLCTLAKIYDEKTRLIGIDISPVALELARRTTLAAGLRADFIEGDTTKLDIPDQSIDGFVLSAMLHEVYSYAENGKDAFAMTIEETYRKTSEGGCIFISDFAAPRIEGQASLQPKSKEAEQFIDYFVNNFRKFNDVEQHTKKPFVTYDRPYMSHGSWVDGCLRSNPAFVSEVLWHFKHYRKNFNDDFTFGNASQVWKEINEVYLPSNPFVSGYKSMPIDDYVNTVIQICQNAEISRDVPLICMSAVLTSQGPDAIDMLDGHFSVVLDDHEATSRSLITECTNWMDLIFKKEPI